MKKKIAATVMAASLAAAMLAGSGSSSSSDTASTSATGAATTSAASETATASAGSGSDSASLRFAWWGGDERNEATQKVIQQFMDAHPGVTIEGEPGSSDGYHDKLATQLASGTAADIVQIDPETMPTFVKSGDYFVDLKTTSIDLDLPLDRGEDQAPVLHNHDYYEIMVVLRGEVDILTEDRALHYSAGDITMPNMNIRHSEINRSNAKILYLCVSESFLHRWPFQPQSRIPQPQLQSFLDTNGHITGRRSYVEFRCLRDPPQVDELLRTMIRELEEQHAGYELMLYALMERLFSYIVDPQNYQLVYQETSMSAEEELTEQLLQYIEGHYRLHSLDHIASDFGYSRDYLNRIFHRQTGSTLGQYLNTIRMNKAGSLLLATDQSIEEIVEMTGFATRSQFYRRFDEYYHQTPVEYRRKTRAMLSGAKLA